MKNIQRFCAMMGVLLYGSVALSMLKPVAFTLSNPEHIDVIQQFKRLRRLSDKDVFGNNVIHNAVIHHYPTELIRLYLEVVGMNINDTDNYGWSPLAHLIVRVSCQKKVHNELELLYMFVDNNLDLKARAKNKRTVFDLAHHCFKGKKAAHIDQFYAALFKLKKRR